MHRARVYASAAPLQPLHWSSISLGLLLIIAISVLSPQARSDDFFKEPALNSGKVPIFPDRLWRKHTPSTDLNLLSPRLMSSEQLIEHASIIREGESNRAHRVLNNMWLTMEQSKRYQGSQALCRLLSVGYLSYRRALTPAERLNPFFHVLDTLHDDAIITHFRNYDIELSTRAFRVSISKRL